MEPSLTFSCGEYKRTRALLEGRIRPEGFRLQIFSDPFPAQDLLPDYQHVRNERMIRERAFDICELGMAPYLSAREAGVPLIAIPVFHYRRFRHRYIFCAEAANLNTPLDLTGRRVGVRRLNLSAGVWARGLLEHEYGVPLESITWVVAIDVPLRPEVRSRLKIQTLPAGRTLIDLLVSGEIDAIIEASDPTANHPDPVKVRPLLGHDTRQMEIDYYSRTGIFPIMHTVVLWNETAQRFPALPEALHQAFINAKMIGAQEPEVPDRYMLAAEEGFWWSSLTHDQKQIMYGKQDPPRDPWIYSAQIDREAIETFLDYAYEQGLTSVRGRIENLFVPSTLKA